MNLFSRFGQQRRLLRTLDRIALALEQQSILLQRLADRFVPLTPMVSAEDLNTSGPTFSRDEEQVRIQSFVATMQKDLKRDPTDEEVVDFLEGRLRSLA